MKRIITPVNAADLLELFLKNPSAESVIIKNLDGGVFFSQPTTPVVDAERWEVFNAAFEMQAKFGNLPRMPRWRVVKRAEAIRQDKEAAMLADEIANH